MDTTSHVRIRARGRGSVGILAACAIGYVLSFQDLAPSHMLRLVSLVLLTGILFSFLMDWTFGLRNLIRVDVFALLAYYFLTYFEFLFPQGQFDLLVNPDDVVKAAHLTLIGLAAMVIGRHLDILPKQQLDKLGLIEMRSSNFLPVFFGAAFLNFLPMMLAVDFNPVEWFSQTVGPRFTQSWGRGKYGDLSALLHELQLLGYVMPPVAGLIFARRKEFSSFTLILVGACMLMLWFSGFASGTRNVLAIQVAGFLAGFFVVQRQLRLKVMIPTVAVVGVIYVVLAGMMLDFRNIGLQRYVEEGRYKTEYRDFEDNYLAGIDNSANEAGYFVDYNLWRLSQIVGFFPEVYGYIGFNMPYVALTKPIPRAFWPGKPMDLAVGLEEAIGAVGYTIAVTWVGEAYVAGGIPWIIAIGLLIGAYCCFWNELAKFIHNPFPLIVFASGFYAILLLMRSLMFFTTALLPSISLIVMGVILYKNRAPA